MELILTSAAKVAEYPGRKNAFSLPAGNSCPFATPTCAKGCYAKKGRFRFTPITRAYANNYAALLSARTAEKMAELLYRAIYRRKFKNFRIHASGDFFSAEYARAWKIVCEKMPDRRFWTYTHSQDVEVLEVLATIENLTLSLSCDQDNWQEMLRLAKQFPSFKLCYYTLGEPIAKELYDHDPGLVVFVDHSVRGKLLFRGNCPAEMGSKGGIPHEGACVRCMRCISPHIPIENKSAA